MFKEGFSDYTDYIKPSSFIKVSKVMKMSWVGLLKRLIPKNEKNYALSLFIPDIVIFEKVHISKT